MAQVDDMEVVEAVVVDAAADVVEAVVEVTDEAVAEEEADKGVVPIGILTCQM
jgi:hypothetical protein